jgi:predicted PurR-regulated permease PerM
MLKQMKVFNKTIIIIVAILAGFIFLSWYFSSIFVYLTVSLILSTILRPLTNYIANQQVFNIRLPRVFAVFFSFFTVVLLFSFFVTIFVPLISDQIQVFSNLDLREVISKIEKPVENFEAFIIEYQLGDFEEGFLAQSIETGLTNFITEIEVSSIVENAISFTGNIFVGVMAITFITFFLLYEKGILRKQIINLIPNAYFEFSIAGLYKVEKLLSNYLLGLLFQMTSIFTIAFIGLSIFGIKYAASIALFAAVMNLIPYMGPLLGSIFGIVIGLSSSGSVVFESNQYLLVIIEIGSVFALVQITDNVLLQPLIFSKSIKAHPLEIFIIIFAGATLAGIVGMIAAIPVYTILRVFAMEIFRGYKSYHIFKT